MLLLLQEIKTKMSDLDPTTQSSSPEAAPQHVDATRGAAVGNIILGQEGLPDPAETLAKIDLLLASPDEEGRMLPKIEVFRDELVKDARGQVAYLSVGYDNAENIGIGRAELVWDYASASEYLRSVRIPGRRGFGRTFYLEMAKQALQRGHDFRNSPNGLKKDGANAWRNLRDLGIASVVEEFRPFALQYGYYVVNGNNRPKKTLGAKK